MTCSLIQLIGTGFIADRKLAKLRLPKVLEGNRLSIIFDARFSSALGEMSLFYQQGSKPWFSRCTWAPLCMNPVILVVVRSFYVNRPSELRRETDEVETSSAILEDIRRLLLQINDRSDYILEALHKTR